MRVSESSNEQTICFPHEDKVCTKRSPPNYHAPTTKAQLKMGSE